MMKGEVVMKKEKICIILILVFSIICPKSYIVKAAFKADYYNILINGGYWTGERYYTASGELVTNAFFCDGVYTYFLQADGSIMKDRLTYHPDGEHVIYFNKYGHEVFSNFANVKKSISGDEINDLCFFDVYGYMYTNVFTFNQAGDKLYYANPYGVMECNGWFQFAEGTGGVAEPLGAAEGMWAYAYPDGSVDLNSLGGDESIKNIYTIDMSKVTAYIENDEFEPAYNVNGEPPVKASDKNNNTDNGTAEKNNDTVTISGKIRYSDGTPYPNCKIKIISLGEYENIETVSDSEGYYEFTDIPAGDYNITAISSNDKTIYNKRVLQADEKGYKSYDIITSAISDTDNNINNETDNDVPDNGTNNDMTDNNTNDNTSDDKEEATGKIWHEPVYEQVWVVDEEAWDEDVYEVHCICNTCGLDLTIAGIRPSSHLGGDEEDCESWHSENVKIKTIHHDEDGHYEQKLVKEGYWE